MSQKIWPFEKLKMCFSAKSKLGGDLFSVEHGKCSWGKGFDQPSKWWGYLRVQLALWNKHGKNPQKLVYNKLRFFANHLQLELYPKFGWLVLYVAKAYAKKTTLYWVTIIIQSPFLYPRFRRKLYGLQSKHYIPHISHYYHNPWEFLWNSKSANRPPSLPIASWPCRSLMARLKWKKMWRCHEGRVRRWVKIYGCHGATPSHPSECYSQWEHWEHLGYPQKLGNPKIRCFQISRCVNQAATLDIQNQIWDVQIWSGGWWRKSFARLWFTSVALQIRKYGVFCLKPGSWGLPPRNHNQVVVANDQPEETKKRRMVSVVQTQDQLPSGNLT